MESEWRPSVLVLAPSFLGGFAHLGALSILEQEGVLRDVNIYCGVSVGSILSLLMICGYTVPEIMTVVLSKDIMRDLCGMRVPSIPGTMNMVYDTLKELVVKKLGTVPTLDGLLRITGKSFITTALNIDTEKVEYFTPQNTPEVPCIMATLLAVSNPFLYDRQKYCGSFYTGLAGDPYPLSLFEDRKVLSLYLRSITEVADTSNPLMTVFRKTRTEELGPSAYISRILQAMIDERVDLTIQQHQDPQFQHLKLESKHIFFTPETLTVAMKSEMIEEGRSGARRFLRTLRRS